MAVSFKTYLACNVRWLNSNSSETVIVVDSDQDAINNLQMAKDWEWSLAKWGGMLSYPKFYFIFPFFSYSNCFFDPFSL